MGKENGQIIELKPQLTKVRVGNWEFFKGPEIKVSQPLKLNMATYMRNLTETLRLTVNGGANFFSWRYGVPSPIIRLDMASLRSIDPYDLETRPDGIGILMGTDPSTIQFIQNIFENIRVLCKKSVCVATLPNTDKTVDDAGAFAKALGLLPNDKSLAGYAIWPRGYNFTPEAMEYQRHSLTDLLRTRREPLKIKAGVRLKSKDGKYQIDLKRPFCLKPYERKLPKDIIFWHPDYSEGNVQIGYSSKKDIERILKQASTKKKEYVIQDLIYPETLRIGDKHYHAVFHIFAGYNFKEGRYELIGGSYTANSSETGIRVHGGKDAVIGPLTFSQNTASQQT